MAMILVAVTVLLVAGCDSMGWGRHDIDGYWKGQMIEDSVIAQGAAADSQSNQRPRRILLKLEESAGVVQGRFAQSSDVVAFKRVDEASSRRISTHTVAGTLSGSRVRIRFSGEAGRTYEVDAVVNKHAMVGTYIAQFPADRSVATSSGRFEIEKF